jgi:hypothetical protein
MKHSALFLGFALAVAGPAALSWAADTGTALSSASSQAAAMPADNLTLQTTIANQALQAYNQDINPLSVVKLASPYDEEDAFKGPNGYALPGWDLFTIDSAAND